MKKILIIDDDLYIGNILEESLTQNGYETIRAYSGTEAVYVLEKSRPDLILLDLMLPGLSGEELIKKIKDTPVIVVSAKVGIDDKVEMLMNGAIDYVTKPFEIKELLARIAAHLRTKSTQSIEQIIEVNGITLNEISHEVYVEGKEVRLTRTEFAILKLLMLNPEQIFSKAVILDRICEDTPDCTENSLKQHICNLRKKLRDIHDVEYIEAIWGIGFRLANKK